MFYDRVSGLFREQCREGKADSSRYYGRYARNICTSNPAVGNTLTAGEFERRSGQSQQFDCMRPIAYLSIKDENPFSSFGFSILGETTEISLVASPSMLPNVKCRIDRLQSVVSVGRHTCTYIHTQTVVLF